MSVKWFCAGCNHQPCVCPVMLPPPLSYEEMKAMTHVATPRLDALESRIAALEAKAAPTPCAACDSGLGICSRHPPYDTLRSELTRVQAERDASRADLARVTEAGMHLAGVVRVFFIEQGGDTTAIYNALFAFDATRKP